MRASFKLIGGVYLSSAAEGGGATFLMQPSVSTLEEMVRHELFFSTHIPVHSTQRALIMTSEQLKTEHHLKQMAEQELKLKQASISLEMKRVFVQHVSHEIRTPLNTVSMGIELVQQLRETGIQLAFGDSSTETIEKAKAALESVFDMLYF